MLSGCKRKLFLVLCLCLVVVFNCKNVLAEPINEEVLKRMEQMENRIKELEGRLAAYESKEKGTDKKLTQVEEKVTGFEGKLEEAKSQGIGALAEGV
mgnify:FL=1